MKVILLENVSAQAKRGQVKNVADGYARNYLLPRKLAVPFTKQGEQKIAQMREKQTKGTELKSHTHKELLEKLKDQIIHFEANASEDGTLYGSIGKKEIIVKIQELFKIKMDAEAILLEKPLKSIGQHRIKLRLLPEKEISLMVDIKKLKQ